MPQNGREKMNLDWYGRGGNSVLQQEIAHFEVQLHRKHRDIYPGVFFGSGVFLPPLVLFVP